jgi:hypothetical protein
VAPAFSTTPAQNGAVVVSLATLTEGATVYYTVNGSTPTVSSIQYLAPFLVDSNLTVRSIAVATGGAASNIASQSFAPNIPSGTLVWSDEFSNATGTIAEPNPQVWTYETGDVIAGNQLLNSYCAWGSSMPPCDPASPNEYVGNDGYLHVEAEQPSPGVYTSAWLTSKSLFSFQYGRAEARMKMPETQGMWPAFWLLGNSWATVNWPSCGELDVVEHIDGSDPDNLGFDWVTGSIHDNRHLAFRCGPAISYSQPGHWRQLAWLPGCDNGVARRDAGGLSTGLQQLEFDRVISDFTIGGISPFRQTWRKAGPSTRFAPS